VAVDRLGQLAQVAVDHPEAVQHACPGRGVTGAGCRVERDPVGENPVVAVLSQVQEVQQRTRQLPRDDLLAPFGGDSHRGDQVGALGLAPVQGVGASAELR
jgi:hypothetical protein